MDKYNKWLVRNNPEKKAEKEKEKTLKKLAKLEQEKSKLLEKLE